MFSFNKLLGYVFFWFPFCVFCMPPPPQAPAIFQATNQDFRDDVVNFIRSVAIQKNNTNPMLDLKELDKQWNNFYQKTDWSVIVSLYYQGKKVGSGSVHGKQLTDTLQTAAQKALNQAALGAEALTHTRFKVAFDYYPAHMYAFIEYGTRGLELAGNKVVQRVLDTSLIQQQIKDSQAYLLRVMHPTLYGFFKFYDAQLDQKETLLRTIYSSSSLYTFLKLYHLNKDAKLESLFKPIAGFILSQQVTEGPAAGGFYYGLYPDNNKSMPIVVVGTTSKTIFTLLELDHFYPDDPQYRQAAIKAGNWLLTMIQADGKVWPFTSYKKGRWIVNTKQSFLYSGQVLSALSRLYAVTHDKRYALGAEKIAEHFLKELTQQGALVGDAYRPPNSISSSWVLMSFIDFAKINSKAIYRNKIEQIAAELLARQITNKEDIFNNGRYLDAMTTSGNGWINEVMGVLFNFCQKEQLHNCNQYRTAMILTSRWLLQNSYTPQNTFNIKNPANAIGGFITNITTETVRTDAVCHGVNSLITLLTMTGQKQDVLVTLPERPLAEILPLLRAGNGFLSQ